MENPNHGELQPNLSAEIAAIVDTLPVIPGQDLATSIAEIRLAYGGQDSKEVMRQVVQENITTKMEACQVNLLTSDRVDRDALGQYMALELGYWLEVAAEHTPEFANQAIREMVETVGSLMGTITGYTSEASAESDQRVTWSHALATHLTRYHGHFVTDPAIVRSFLQSDFFEAFGSQTAQLDLYRQLVKLEGHTSEYGFSEDYLQMLDALRATLNRLEPSKGMDHESIEAALLITRHTPLLIPAIAERHPHAGREICARAAEYALRLDESLFTDEHQSLIDAVETAFRDDPVVYNTLITAYRDRYNELSAQQLNALEALLESNPQAYPEKIKAYHCWLICKHSSPEDLMRIMAEKPSILADPQVSFETIRRLAEHGRPDLAMELVQQDNTRDTYFTVYNALIVYEESGEQQALTYAQEKSEGYFLQPDLEPADPNTSIDLLQDMHSFALLRSFGARRHGQEELAAEAEAEVAAYHSSPHAIVRGLTLQDTVFEHLERGDIAGCEQYVGMLLYDQGVQSLAHFQGIGYEQLLQVVRAYVEDNHPEQALRFTKQYLLENPFLYHQQDALLTRTTLLRALAMITSKTTTPSDRRSAFDWELFFKAEDN